MSTHTSILLDMDGVLIDNLAFDSAVTRYIVRSLAEQKSVTLAEAQQSWDDELQSTSGTHLWYDYDFHSRRLGLGELSASAHNASASLLRPYADAHKTIDFLREAGLRIGVASDAPRWVVDLKLRTLEFAAPDFILSSDAAGALKASPGYWSYFTSNYPEDLSCIYVDNRLDNLETAARELDDVDLVCFVGDEHALHASGIGDPNNQVRYPEFTKPITVVADHYELAECIVDLLVA